MSKRVLAVWIGGMNGAVFQMRKVLGDSWRWYFLANIRNIVTFYE
jgi:hypothetical protein